jgi:hypothetical protein
MNFNTQTKSILVKCLALGLVLISFGPATRADQSFRSSVSFDLSKEAAPFLAECSQIPGRKIGFDCPNEDLVTRESAKREFQFQKRIQVDGVDSPALVRANKLCLLLNGTPAIAYTLGKEIQQGSWVQIIFTDTKISRVIGVEQKAAGPQMGDSLAHSNSEVRYPIPFSSVTCKARD